MTSVVVVHEALQCVGFFRNGHDTPEGHVLKLQFWHSALGRVPSPGYQQLFPGTVFAYRVAEHASLLSLRLLPSVPVALAVPETCSDLF